ncbi:hypothetical protein, variant [Verruconis gallopava]|nr:hypothetical protein, variant [Verruconis gallopava]KIW01930.1 hypothetical protein, variant [Verruconis gallopava]
MSWGQADEISLRQRLGQLPLQLESLCNRLRESPTAQIDRALQVLAREVSNGRHETMTATSLSTTALDPDDDAGWAQITRDLGDLGVAHSVIASHKDYIIDWILRAINAGVLTDEKMPVESATLQLPQVPPPRPPKTPVIVTSTAPTLVHSVSVGTLPGHLRPSSMSSPPEYSRAQSMSGAPQMARSASPPILAAEIRRQPSVSPPSLRPVVSTDVLNHASTINMDEPPSPIEPEPPESNILWNAQRISYHWNRREWRQARDNIEAQIACVERGEIVDVCGFPQQPDERILRHLLGVCHSLSGDFIKAREAFESVLSGPNVSQLVFDDGDIAAARWLGETCIMSSQVVNAALAWAVAYYATSRKIPQDKAATLHMLEDVHELNLHTSGLIILTNAFTNSNRDASTILSNLASTHKFTIVTSTLQDLSRHQKSEYVPRRMQQNVSIAEGFLIQPLVAQKSWPLPQDPFFQVKSSIRLLFELSRPRTPISTTSIPSTSFGSSKKLVYVTKNSIEWLVEAIRYALNTYAVEWKIRHSEYLLRLSQTHDRIAYYECFVIKFRKLSFRNLWGFKLTESAYATRKFTSSFRLREDGTPSAVVASAEEPARKEKLRAELADRLKEYVKQAEIDLAKGNWPPPADEELQRAPYEVDSTPSMQNELGDHRAGWELSGQSAVRRKPIHEPMSYEIAELPG